VAYTPHTWTAGETIDAAKLNANEQGTQAAAAAADTANSALAGKVNSSTYTAGLAAKADTASLAPVATSGSYNDLTNKPTIPTVSGTNTGDQTLSLNGSSLTISGANGNSVTIPTSGGTTVSDASTTAKGIVQLAGDLGGTAAAPTVPGLAGKLSAASNLSDVANAATARTNLGLGTAATQPSTAFDASGAASAAQAAAVQRANHTGTQAASTITGLATVATSGAYTDLAGKPTIPTVGAAGAGAGVALSSTDASVTNSRTPTAHAATHGSGGSDPISPASIGAASLLTTQTQQTGTTYTFVLADGNTLVESNNASAVTFTVPPNSSVAFPVGTSISLRQYGAGQVTVAAGSGVTLRSRGGVVKTAGQYAEATLTQRSVDEWVLSGDLA
jgi:hypothetical protein